MIIGVAHNILLFVIKVKVLLMISMGSSSSSSSPSEDYTLIGVFRPKHKNTAINYNTANMMNMMDWLAFALKTSAAMMLPTTKENI